MAENRADILNKELDKRTFRLRVAQTILILAILISLGFLITSNYRLTTANNKLQSQTITLLNQQKETLEAITKVSAQRSIQIQDLQNHIDCLFKLATTPHSTSNPPQVTSISVCNLATSPTNTSGVTSLPKVSQTQPSVSQSQPQVSSPQPGAQPASPSSMTTPKSPGIVRRVLNFLGL